MTKIPSTETRTNANQPARRKSDHSERAERAAAQQPAIDRVEPCSSCGADLSSISMVVDGASLMMESCDGCDVRRWHLAGSQIDLQKALGHVGERASRRR